jgi:hypothetical protein
VYMVTFVVGNLEVFSSLFALRRLWVVECANVYIVHKCAILRILMYGVCVRILL